MNTINEHQKTIVDEFVSAYDIKPEDILFFDEKPEPFFTYKASCLLINQLLNPADMQTLPFESETPDSISRQIVIRLVDGRTRSSVGVVNLKETINGVEMSDSQREELAAARGMRQVIRLFGLDLLKLHRSGGQILDFKLKSNKASLIGQAHQLGKELFWITSESKKAWYLQLSKRYKVQHSNELSEIQLGDFIAFMRSLTAPQQLAA
jgi:hypothetical protein